MMRRSNICLLQIQKGGNKKNEKEIIDITTENFSDIRSWHTSESQT